MDTDSLAGPDPAPPVDPTLDTAFWQWALPAAEQVNRGGGGWPPGALANAAATVVDRWRTGHPDEPLPRLIELLLEYAEAEAQEPDHATVELAATATGDPAKWTPEQAAASARTTAYEMVGRARSRQRHPEPSRAIRIARPPVRRARSCCGARRRPGARRTTRANAPPRGDADPGGDPEGEPHRSILRRSARPHDVVALATRGAGR